MTHARKTVFGFLVTAWALSMHGKAQSQDVGQCIAKTAGCAKNVAQAQLDVLSGAVSVLAFAAKNPHCVADIVATNLITIGISGSMTALAGAGVLKKDSSGSYMGHVYGEAARPMVQAITTVVPVPALTDLLVEGADVGIGAAFKGVTSSIPIPSAGAPNLAMQLECGDAIAGAGMQMIGDVKKVIGTAKLAVKSCSAAASCFATVLLDIVKDPVGAVGSGGEFIADTADDIKDFVFGGCKNTPVQAYFDGRFKPRVNEIAWQTVWGGQPGYYKTISENLVNQCVKDYDSCDSDKDTAKRQCVVMSSGAVQTDGNGWIAGKGLEQLVRARELELGVPKYLDVTTEWTDNEQKTRVKAGIAKVYGDMAPAVKAKMAKLEFHESGQLVVRKKAVRDILGVSGNSKPPPNTAAKITLPQGSIGALMLGYVPAEGPAPGNWSYKANEIFKKYYPQITGNPKLLGQIDDVAEKALIKQKETALQIGGDAINKELAKEAVKNAIPATTLPKYRCPPGDKECGEKVQGNLLFTETALIGLGKADNYAGMGAWGVNAPAHQKYVAFIKAIPERVAEIVASAGGAQAGLIVGGSLANGAAVGMESGGRAVTASTTTLGAVGTGSAPMVAPELGAHSAMVPPRQVPPAPNGRVGMPGLPTMGALPVFPKANTLPQGVTPPVGSVGAVNGVGGAGGPAGAVGAVGNTGPDTVRVGPGNLADLSRTQRLPNQVALANPGGVPVTGGGSVAAAGIPEVKAPSGGFASNLPPSVMGIPGAKPPGGGPGSNLPPGGLANNLPPGVSGAGSAIPFNAPLYRREREGALNDKWLGQCRAGPCRQTLTGLIAQRVDAEVQSITAGNPDHKNKPAVEAFIRQLDQRMDPVYLAEVAKSQPAAVAPPAPPTGTVAPNSSQIGSKIPKGFKPPGQ